MSIDTVRHALSFAVRFVDHFGGAPVPDELPVRLAGSFARPAIAPGGRGYRQADGSYRFINVPAGRHRVMWRDPFARSQAGWMRWTEIEPELELPLGNPAQIAEFELWPDPAAAAGVGTCGVRGKLSGAFAAGQQVRIALQGQPFDRFTCCDAAGEFLFLLQGRLPPSNTGLLPLRVAVQEADGTPRLVTGGGFIPPATGTAFGADTFAIKPGAIARIRFTLT